MFANTPPGLAAQREKILALLADAPDVAFIRHRGNIGDDLIHAGTRRLLADIPCREFGTWDLQHARGHTAVITGSGGWCVPFHHQLPQALPLIEQRFRRVVILPSTFDLKEPIVRDALARTKALVFARERASYEQIRGVCDADIGHDCAFFFDFAPYRRRGSGHLLAYRTDAESARSTVPAGNNDVSVACFGLDHWLWTIARHETVETDRAHVMIAAAMLGKRVTYSGTNYHKVPAIAAYSLSGFSVSPALGGEPTRASLG
ncbi:MAG TPA: polysaccharide pyruvyl transferase family protein [Xanthobacteraceae bacterium]|nr:polysaccharide pyruvyl transferase family protein [Xanthobacteraceae bacterium]